MSEDPYAKKPWLAHYDEGVPADIDYPKLISMNFQKILQKIMEGEQQFGS